MYRTLYRPLVVALTATLFLACADSPKNESADSTQETVEADTAVDSNDTQADVADTVLSDTAGDSEEADTGEADTEPDVPDDDTAADVADTVELPDVEDTTMDVEADVADTAGPPLITCAATLSISAPTDGTVVYAGGLSVTATVTITDDGAPSDYEVVWTTAAGALPVTSEVLGSGQTTAQLSGLDLGSTAVIAQLQTSDGVCEGVMELRVIACASSIAETFDMAPNPAVWAISGDAVWQPSGWIELTGLAQDHAGAFTYIAQKVASGSTSMRFRVFTGGGSPGADGFAISFVDATDLTELQTVTSSAANGGGLGYAYGGAYGPYDGGAFTVEIDTWFNQFNGTTEFHTDPTSENHLEVTTGLDPGNSVAHVEVPSIEDQQWHDVQVDIVESKLKVWLDDALLINVDVPGLKFPGGYILMSGSTGFYFNYHRFDDLEILHSCTPAAP